MAQLDPNIILDAAPRPQPIDPAALLQARSTIRLNQLAVTKAQGAQDALDKVRADPTNMSALADLAAYDPTAAKGYLGVQDFQRAAATRASSAALIRTLGSTGFPAAGVSPVPAAPPAAQSPVPAVPGAAVAPPSAAPATPSGIADDHFLHPANPATVAAGAAVASRAMTPAEAAAKLAETADPGQLDQVLGTIKGLDGLRLSRLSESNGALASAAQTLLQQTPGQTPEQRRAVAMRMAPQLAQHGVTPEMIANADLTDTGLHGIIGQAVGVDAAIKQANDDRKFGLDVRQQDETERHNRVDESKPVTVGFGNVAIDPRTHAVVYDGSGGASGGDTSRIINAAAGGGQVPQSVQTLGQFVDFGKSLNAQGAKSSSAGTYQINGSTMAQFAPQVLGPKWQDAPFNADSQEKVGEAIFNWAKSQPNPASALRGRWVGLSLPQAAGLVSGTWQQARGAIAQSETGGSMGGSGGSGAGGMSAAAIDLAAREGIANGGTVPAGYSRNRAAQAAITNRMAELAQGKDVSSIIQSGQDTKSQGAAFKTWNSGKPNTGAAQVRSLSVATDHLDQLSIAAKALNNGSTPLFNRISQAYAQQTGSAIPTNFEAIKGFVTDEAVKAIVGAGGGVSDREHAAQLVSKSNSPEQLAGAVRQIQGLMAGQLHGLSSQYKQTTGRDDFERYVSPRARQVLEGAGAGAGGVPRVTNAEDYKKIASGASYTDPTGVIRTKR